MYQLEKDNIVRKVATAAERDRLIERGFAEVKAVESRETKRGNKAKS